MIEYRLGTNTLSDAANTSKGAFDMPSLKRSTSLILFLLLALPLLLVACGSPSATGTPTSPPTALVKGEFVGDAGQLAGIGLSTNGQQVIAYLCNGDDQHVSLAEWFSGPPAS